MKKYNLIILSISCLMEFLLQGQQSPISVCNNFDNIVIGLNIDSSSVWEIGNLSKTIFNNSYSGENSIVTSLDSSYSNSDTSNFYIQLTNEWNFPNYLGGYYPLVLDFKHRFNTDTLNDYGKIEISFDNDPVWYNVHDILKGYSWWTWGEKKSFHVFLETGDTLYQDISISGNSNGWIHTRYYITYETLVYDNNLYPLDTMVIKFSFITDSIENNYDGWQIDDLNVFIKDDINSIKSLNNTRFKLYPNPFNEHFKVDLIDESFYKVSVFNGLGSLVQIEYIKGSSIEIDTKNYPKGIYFVKILEGNKESTIKVLKE